MPSSQATPFKAIVATLLVLGSGAAFAKKGHKAHEHGAMTLSVAVDGTTVAIGGEMPGDDAFGFEHPPRNAQETAAIKDAMATLRNKSLELFQLPAEAGCTLKEAKVVSPLEAFALGTAKETTTPAPVKGKKEEDHNDVDTDYTFTCAKPVAGGVLKLGLLKAFPRLRTVRVQLNANGSQSGQTVKSADDGVKL